MSHASHSDQRVLCYAFIPDAQTLLVWLSEVKQTHYYGMETSSVSGPPGSLGTAPKRGEPGWGMQEGARITLLLMPGDGPLQGES